MEDIMKIIISTTIIVGFILSAGISQARETSTLQSFTHLNELVQIHWKNRDVRGHSHTPTKHRAHRHHYKDRVEQKKQHLGTKQNAHRKAHPIIHNKGHQHKKYEYTRSRVQSPTAGKKK